MKKGKSFFVLFSCVFLLGITALPYVQTNSNEKLRLIVGSDKKAYLLGEAVNFSFELKNKSKDTISLLDEFGVRTGNLHVEISQNGRDFLGFNNPSWGTIDTTRKTLIQPEASANASGQVLWSWLKQGSPQFRLKEPGDYYFRAIYVARVEGEVNPVRLESESIKVTIAEPIAEDLEVWKKIKDNGNFAYFILEGDFLIPDHKIEERAKFQGEIGQILFEYPNSFYSASLRESLDNFRAREARNQQFLNRVHNPR